MIPVSKIFLVLLLVMAPALYAQETIVVSDADIPPGSHVTFKSNNVYVLDGFVFVDSTATLTIEAGTVVKAKSGEGTEASALIVARGGKIFANGTKDAPVIFTAESDDLNDSEDLLAEDRGLWGGLIILGKASINVAGGVEQIEGIPITESRGQYGGTDDNDNSGSLRFVSIRHGGSNIGANNEINGVTFGGVGRGTIVDHVEVYANSDDGFEWFGGTVDCRYLVSAFNGDDAFDWDQGYRGRGQFWFTIQDAAVGNSAFECDGGTTPEDGEPYSIPTLYNVTAIGSGSLGSNAKNTPLVNLRDNSGGKFFNSIFVEGRGYGAHVEDLESGQDSRSRLESGDLSFQYNTWFSNKNGLADSEDGQQFFLDYLNNPENLNVGSDPMIQGISREPEMELDPRISAGSPAFSDYRIAPNDGFFFRAEYKGAFNANSLWIKRWTAIDELGYVVEEESGTVVVTDADIKEGESVLWSANNTYILDGFVFVDNKAVLTIEAGTVIKGRSGEGANASALIVAQGGKIFAQGTQQQPIIFTAEADDLDDDEDLTQDDRGLWGGLIILGRASINVAGGIEQIEGIPVTEPRGQYGGDNDDDGSGSLTYVSVRHGGSNIGANNEINGVTFGGVGRNTEVSHIEVFANADDGFEWFGGTVNTKYLVSAYNGDDSFDWDQGFRGKGQFWFAIMSATVGNSAFESDGGTTPEDGEPYSIPVLSNITAIGSGASGANAKNTPLINVRDNSGGKFYNSIFVDGRGTGVSVEDLESGEDSRARLEAGDLLFGNNIWHEFKSGVASTDEDQNFLVEYLAREENVNEEIDPKITAVSRSEDGIMDPRPESGSPAFRNVADLGDAWFNGTGYRGAFGQGPRSNWLEDWSVLWTSGLVTDVEEDDEPLVTPKVELYPNPIGSGIATLRFSIATLSPTTVSVFDSRGSLVRQVAAGTMFPVGPNELRIDVDQIDVGAYLVLIKNANGTLAVPMRILR